MSGFTKCDEVVSTVLDSPAVFSLVRLPDRYTTNKATVNHVSCHSNWVAKFIYVTVPRKQLNQDFSTNMLLKIYLCIILMLTMAPNIPQCTLKMLVIQPGPPFHFNEVEMVKKRDWASKKVVRSWLKFSLKLRILTQFTSVRDLPIFLDEIIHLINMSV